MTNRSPVLPRRGGSAAPPPSGGRLGGGNRGFPRAPARGRVKEQPSRRGTGKPGFPIPPPGGKVWEGAALPMTPPPPSPSPAGGGNRAPPPSGGRPGGGKPGFPIPPPGGRVWEGRALPGTTVCSSRRCAAQPHEGLTGGESGWGRRAGANSIRSGGAPWGYPSHHASALVVFRGHRRPASRRHR